MKKIFLGLAFALFAVQVNAATLITISNDSFTGGGSVTSDSNFGAAIVGHDDINNGSFTDVWNVTLDPASATFNVATSSPEFSSFNAEYSLDDGTTWTSFSNSSVLSGISETLWETISVQSDFKVKVWGNTGENASSYDLRVEAVPLPAAVWLFGSALMGLVGVSRRKSTALAA